VPRMSDDSLELKRELELLLSEIRGVLPSLALATFRIRDERTEPSQYQLSRVRTSMNIPDDSTVHGRRSPSPSWSPAGHEQPPISCAAQT
jgi:hypothetical protein